MIRNFTTVAAAAALAVAAFATAPVFAEQTSVAVRYTDLDLSKSGDVATLNRRVSVAINQVCGDADGRDLDAVAAVSQCRQSAHANAAAQIATVINGSEQQALNVHGEVQVASR